MIVIMITPSTFTITNFFARFIIIQIWLKTMIETIAITIGTT